MLGSEMTLHMAFRKLALRGETETPAASARNVVFSLGRVPSILREFSPGSSNGCPIDYPTLLASRQGTHWKCVFTCHFNSFTQRLRGLHMQSPDPSYGDPSTTCCFVGLHGPWPLFHGPSPRRVDSTLFLAPPASIRFTT